MQISLNKLICVELLHIWYFKLVKRSQIVFNF